MRRMLGIEMILPNGSSSDDNIRYAKLLQARSIPFVQHRELLVLEKRTDAPGVIAELALQGVATSACPLLQLPPSVSFGADYNDYIVPFPGGHAYLDLNLAAVFRLTEEEPEAEPAPALLQLEEHLIASFHDLAYHWQAIDRQLAALAERIAGIYRCGLIWLDFPEIAPL